MSSSIPIDGKQETVDSSLSQFSVPQVGSSDDEDSREQAIQTGVVRSGDQIFKILAVGSSVLVTAAIIAVAVFLFLRAVPAMSRNEANFFTCTERWNPVDTSAMCFDIPNVSPVTVAASILALTLVMPVALDITIFLTAHAPKKLVKLLGYLADLLVAVPPIVCGPRGFMALDPALAGLYGWLVKALGFILMSALCPNSSAFETGRNLFTSGTVLAIMILPVVVATTREVFVQTPRGRIEASLVLGATRWEMVKLAILLFGRSDFISGSMLSSERAFGKTMTLYLAISPSSTFRGSFFDGGTTFATAVANTASKFNDNLKAGAYISTGLVLFLLTFVVNSVARLIAEKQQGRRRRNEKEQ